jgi:hypothetical protein
MEAHPSVGFTYGGVVVFSGDPLPRARTRPRSWIIWPGHRWLERRWETGRNCIISPEVVMRSAVQRRIGAYRSDLPHTADLEMWMRAAAVADVGYVKGADQGYYRSHPNNMHATMFGGRQPRGLLVDLEHLRMTFEALAPEAGSSAAVVAARRAIAIEALKAASRSYTWHAADEALVDQLMSFARETYRDAPTLRWWRLATERRIAIARDWSTRSAAFRARLTTLRAMGRAQRWRWEQLGA